MILVLSENKDKSTTVVLSWLRYFNKKYIRVNKEDILKIKCLTDGIYININKEKEINITEITSFWYRRGFLNLKNELKNDWVSLSNFLNEESYHLKNYIHYLLKEKNSLGSISSSIANKLIVNELAVKSNLRIPKSYLFTEKKELLKVFKKNKLITKVIAGNGFVNLDDNQYGVFYTTLLEDINDFPENFAPSYFQEYINKRYELRIFFLKGKFYSMAIFSQNDEQTKVDFRKYNFKKPNRNVAFKLPVSIEKRLLKLMDLMNLKCASIDMLVDNNLQYYFLEVNPIGQFGMVSYPCNYGIEKLIAKNVL